MDRAAQGRSPSRTGHGAPEEQTNLPDPRRASPSHHGRTIYSVAPPTRRGTNATNWQDKGKSIFPPVEVDRSGHGPYPWSSAADRLLNVNSEPRNGPRTHNTPHEASEAAANEERGPNPNTSDSTRSRTPPPKVFDRDDHVPISEYRRKRARLAAGGPRRVNHATAPVAVRKRKAQLPVALNRHEEKRIREDDTSDDVMRALEAGVAQYFWTSDSGGAPRPPSRRSSSPMDTSDDCDTDDGTESDSSAYSLPDFPESEADYDHKYDTESGADDRDEQEDDDMDMLTWPKALSDHPRDRLSLYKPAVPTPLNPARAATLTPLELRHAYALAFKHKHPYMTSAYDRPAFVARYRSDCDNRVCVPWNVVLRPDQEPRSQKRCRACMQEQDQPRDTWKTRASRRLRAQLRAELDVLERLFQEEHERSAMYDDDGYGYVDYSEAYE